MAARSAEAILCAVLTAACLAGSTAPAKALAAETSGWSDIPEKDTAADTDGASADADTDIPAGDADTAADTDTDTQAAAGNSADSGIAREKRYLLEALDQLQEMGLSPILIWSEITKDPKVVDAIDSAKDTAWDAVTQKVSEAGENATKAVGDAVRTEAEKGRKSLRRMIREQIQSFLDGLVTGDRS